MSGWGRLEIDGGQRVFAPGDEVAGKASWHLEEAPESVEVRLYWETQGKGDRDVDVVASESTGGGEREGSFQRLAGDGELPFRFRLPEGPYSFSGKLISLLWGVELVAEPGGALGQVEIVVSPIGAEIHLGKPDAPG